MSQRMKCVACGREGYDVGVKIVRNDDPNETEMVLGKLVPKRFTAQVRCSDPFACQDRQDDPTLALGDDE